MKRGFERCKSLASSADTKPISTRVEPGVSGTLYPGEMRALPRRKQPPYTRQRLPERFPLNQAVLTVACEPDMATRARSRDASVMPAALPEVGKPCKAGLSFSRSISGILGTRVGHPDRISHGYAKIGTPPASPNAAKWRARDAPVMPRPYPSSG